jgi:uroporphyrinogen decarboxylase
MKAETGGSIPIIGVAMSPFSLPVMQMGFDRYLELMYEEPGLFRHLMEINEAFEVAWANAQLEAGAHVICYFDPVSSPTIIPPERYRDSGKVIATRTISRIKGPVVTHFASGRCLPVLDDVIETGTVALGVSSLEDLRELKNLAAGRLTLVGNLNGVEMRRWTPEQAEVAVRDAIACAGRGGGFILSDNHGEIPWLVPEEVLMAIAEASRKWGTYPLDWINEYEP